MDFCHACKILLKSRFSDANVDNLITGLWTNVFGSYFDTPRQSTTDVYLELDFCNHLTDVCLIRHPSNTKVCQFTFSFQHNVVNPIRDIHVNGIITQEFRGLLKGIGLQRPREMCCSIMKPYRERDLVLTVQRTKTGWYQLAKPSAGMS